MAYTYDELSADKMRTCIHGGNLVKVIATEVSIPLTENDIFNWLMDCQSPETLRRLGKAALNFARGIEDPDNDDFRSRA